MSSSCITVSQFVVHLYPLIIKRHKINPSRIIVSKLNVRKLRRLSTEETDDKCSSRVCVGDSVNDGCSHHVGKLHFVVRIGPR